MSKVNKKAGQVLTALVSTLILGSGIYSCTRPTVLDLTNTPEVKTVALMAVPNQNRIDVVSTEDNRVSTTLSTDDKPSSMAVSPDGRLILVTNANSGTVSVFLRRDNEDFVKLNSVGGGNKPSGIAFNSNSVNNEAYVAYEGDGKILVLDTRDKNASPKISKVLSLPGSAPRKIVVNKTGNRIFVTDVARGMLIILNKAGQQFTRNEISLIPNSTGTTPGTSTYNLEGMAISSQDKIYIADNTRDSVIVVDGNSPNPAGIQTISLKDNIVVGASSTVGPKNLTIYKSPAGKEKVYVAGYSASVISVIDGNRVKNIPLSQNSGRDSANPVGVAVGNMSGRGDVIYVTNSSGLTLSIIDPVTDTLLRNTSTSSSSAKQDPLGEILTIGPAK